MRRNKVMNKLQKRIDQYVGYSDENARQLAGTYSILVDLITVLSQKKVLSKQDRKLLFDPWPAFDGE